jgi:hypothetical protein
MTTALNNIIFTMLNTLKTISWDISAAGNINTRQTITPKAQNKLISWEDFRFSILMIKGIFQNGKIIAAIIPIILIILPL